MLAAKQQLEIDVENLEARLKMVEVAQTTSEFNFDDSHLARTRELVSDIHTRIEVSAKLLDAQTDFHARIPLDLPQATEDISDQIAQYFTGGEQLGEEVSKVAESGHTPKVASSVLSQLSAN